MLRRLPVYGAGIGEVFGEVPGRLHLISFGIPPRITRRSAPQRHNGAGVGGMMSQKFGVTEPYWTATGSCTVDIGRVAP